MVRILADLPRTQLRNLLLSGFLALHFFEAMGQDRLSTKDVAERFEVYHQQIPTEKVYLHTSRETLTLGDTLYLSCYVLDGQYHTPTQLSGMLHVNLISPNEEIISSLRLKVDSLGRAAGAISLSDSLKAGNYALRAYTHYQLNYDEDFRYSKSIRLLPRLSKQKVVPEETSENAQMNLTFFPEGGEIVAGSNNFIAFKAVDQKGYPINFTGRVIDAEGKRITTISSEHDGMGKFMITPKNESLYACEYEFDGKLYSQPLPDVRPSGYLLQVRAAAQRISIEAKGLNTEIAGAFLMIQCRGTLLYLIEPQPEASSIQLWLDPIDLPTGITQLTLFDPNHQAVAERLIYNENPNTVTHLEIYTDKQTYSKRSLVNLNLSLEQANGKTTDLATLSTTVLPKNLHIPPAHTITSFLHLNADLKGYIHNPTHYFKQQDPDRLKHLDLLMMTHGWRRFQWEKVISLEGPEITYPYERAVRVEGQVTGIVNKKKSVTSDLVMSFLDNPLIQLNTTSDENGQFWFDGLNFTDTVMAYVKTLAEKAKKREAGKVKSFTFIQIKDHYIPPIARGFVVPFKVRASDTLLIKKGEKLFDVSSAFDERVIILDELVIEESIHPENDPFNRRGMLHSAPDNRVVLDSLPILYPTIFHYMSMIPGVLAVINQSVTIRGGTPMFILDGFPIEFDQFATINVRDILFIDVLKGPRAFIYGPRAASGAVVMFTRRGDEYNNLPDSDPEGLAVFPLAGFTPPREFYMPDYSNPSEKEMIRPDFRSTIYWNPSLHLRDRSGTDFFYTSDEAGEFIIYSEGVSTDGEMFTGQTTFRVE